MVRALKAILVLFASLQGFAYVAGNLANFDAARAVVSFVISQTGHEYYPTHIVPAFAGDQAATIALLVIVAGEALVGLLCLKGALDLFTSLGADDETFHARKTFALLGTGMGMIVWFGGFIVIGAGFFQMWQTEIGDSSFRGAFIYAVTNGLVYLIVSQPERR
jgi:predicted small integral membrane protein